MIKTKLTGLTLAGLLALATGSAFAGSTGPTDPIDTNGPRTGSSSMGENVDGTTTSPKTSTPGTKGMGGNNGTNGSTTQGGGMTNGDGMGGNGGGMSNGNGMGGSGGGAGGSSGSK